MDFDKFLHGMIQQAHYRKTFERTNYRRAATDRKRMNMLTMNIGPFALSSSILLLLAAGLAAAGIGHLVGRRQHAGIVNTLFDMLFAGVIVARIAFVAVWFDTYRSAPWSMLDIRDGGFMLWAGAVAALLVAIWRGWRQPVLRKPLMLGLLAGVLVWGVLFGALRSTARPVLPKQMLMTLGGVPTDLAALAQGKPMVVNLWASWCPPCRREMPVLAAAQKRETGVSFVFVNQGEDESAAQHYLSAGKIDLANVLLDPTASVGHAVGSGALPTTLFYNAQGQLIDTHVGGLSDASLANKLNQMRPPSAPAGKD
jgi:thiol-disulfide isomerase/thioredoxin